MPNIVKVLLNSVFSFIYLFIIAKLLGKKQVAQLTVVDYVVGISIGSIAAQWCTDAETPWYFYAIGMGIFFIFSSLVDFFERKTPLKQFFKGRQIELVTNGKVNYNSLKKSKLDINDMLGLCRAKGFFDLNDIAFIFFETDGSISILPRGEEKPTVVSDLIKPKIQKSSPAMYPIIDGKVNQDVLNQMQKSVNWLYKHCNIVTKKDLKNIILAEYISQDNSVIVHYKK